MRDHNTLTLWYLESYTFVNDEQGAIVTAPWLLEVLLPYFDGPPVPNLLRQTPVRRLMLAHGMGRAVPLDDASVTVSTRIRGDWQVQSVATSAQGRVLVCWVKFSSLLALS